MDTWTEVLFPSCLWFAPMNISSLSNRGHVHRHFYVYCASCVFLQRLMSGWQRRSRWKVETYIHPYTHLQPNCFHTNHHHSAALEQKPFWSSFLLLFVRTRAWVCASVCCKAAKGWPPPGRLASVEGHRGDVTLWEEGRERFPTLSNTPPPRWSEINQSNRWWIVLLSADSPQRDKKKRTGRDLDLISGCIRITGSFTGQRFCWTSWCL